MLQPCPPHRHCYSRVHGHCMNPLLELQGAMHCRPTNVRLRARRTSRQMGHWARLTWLVCPKVEGSPAFDLARLRGNLFLTIPAPSNPTTTHAATGNRFKKFDQVIAQRSVLADNGRMSKRPKRALHLSAYPMFYLSCVLCTREGREIPSFNRYDTSVHQAACRDTSYSRIL